ncbi:MAG: helix-turn-helix transcriptional regulator [Bacteroidales bacterium]|nr:helix-turn-helix transcriptional regulator [Bacteroidales bacterium]
MTELGEFLWQLRRGRDELLYDMANNLGMSPSELSAVENGRRLPPEGFIEAVSSCHWLDSNDKEHLAALVASAEACFGQAKEPETTKFVPPWDVPEGLAAYEDDYGNIQYRITR